MSETARPLSVATVENDGWEIQSASVMPGARQTEEQLRAILADDSAPAAEGGATADEASSSSPDDAAHPAAKADKPEDDATGEKTDDKPEAPKKKGTLGDRVGELRAEVNSLTRVKHQTREEIAALERKRAELRDAIAADERSRAGDKAATAKPPAPVTAKPTAAAPEAEPPQPLWSEFEAAGKDWDEYAKAHKEWLDGYIARKAAPPVNVDEIVQRRLDEERQKAQALEAAERYRASLQAVREEHEDFDEVIKNLDDVDQSPFLRDVVQKHPAGAQYLYHLAQNPDECRVLASMDLTHADMDAVMELEDPTPLLAFYAENPDYHRRLRAMSPRQAYLALGSLITRLEGANAGTHSTAPPHTTAPKPLRPVGGKRSVAESRPRSSADMPFEAYVAAENAREGRRL